MAMDMPPRQVVEYRVERAAPSPMAGMVARAAAERPSIAAMMPKLDLSSTAIGQAERRDLVTAMEANRGGMADAPRPTTSGYVSKRIRAAIAVSRANDAITLSGAPDARQARDAKCLVVAAAMDPAAARYVEGGAQAAVRARAAVPASWIAECAHAPATMRQAASTRPVSVTPEAGRDARVSRPAVDPARSQRVAPVPVRPSLGKAAPVRVDPELGRRPPQRLDLTSTSRPPVRIDPQGTRRVPVSMGKGPDHGAPSLAQMSAARTRDGGRG